jgi:CBS domain containing-hemolysin-like protein
MHRYKSGGKLMVVWKIVFLVIFIFLAGFYAGSETGAYRLSRFRLRMGRQQKRRFFTILGNLVSSGHSLLFTTLVGTNLSHYIVTSIATYILLELTASEKQAEFYATLAMTPILFIYTELIPKNLYFYRADSLMPRLAPLLWISHKLFTYSGIVPALEAISKGLSRLLGLPVSSQFAMGEPHHFSQIIKESREEGHLSAVQSEIMNRLIHIPNMRIGSVMVPVNKVGMIDVNTNRDQLLKELTAFSFTRLLVFEGNRENIIGFIDVYESLANEKDFADLHSFVKPIPTFPADGRVIDALNRMRKEHHKITLILRSQHGREKPVGIITMKDLVEELTGELTEW